MEQTKVDNAKKTSSVQVLKPGGEGLLHEKFGSRQLENPEKVFDHNAWDNVDWDEEQERLAEEIVEKQKAKPVSEEEKGYLIEDAALNWDKFYRVNQNRFFKDRNWLKLEFPELFQPTESKRVVMELGCGAGNTFFPLLAANADPNLFAYCCDFSEEAVAVVKSNPAYDTTRGEAFVWNISSATLPPQVEEGSVDVIIMVFVFSALQPSEWKQTLENIYKLLAPGGIVLFRDYGRYDLAQLRFKSGRYIDEHFYARGDGTRVYFFSSEEMERLFGERLEVLQNAVDRRLLVNRAMQLKMYRVWLQGKFRKAIPE